MNWGLFGDLILVSLIIGSGILFVYANVNYKPDNDNDGV